MDDENLWECEEMWKVSIMDVMIYKRNIQAYANAANLQFQIITNYTEY